MNHMQHLFHSTLREPKPAKSLYRCSDQHCTHRTSKNQAKNNEYKCHFCKSDLAVRKDKVAEFYRLKDELGL